MRGEGRVNVRGGCWWIGFRANGQEHRERAMLADKHGAPRAARSEIEACKALSLRRAAVLGGRFVGLQAERCTVGELLDDKIKQAKAKGLRSVDKLESHTRAAREGLGHLRAADLTTARVEAFTAERLAEGRAPATVARELEILRSAFRLGHSRTPRKVASVPLIPLPRVENARQGFVTPGDFERILAGLEDPDVRDFIEWSGATGMRPGESRPLTWSMWDRESKALTLSARAAKIGEARTIALEGRAGEIIKRRNARRRLDTGLIFHRTSKGKDGQPLDDYRGAWGAACELAGFKAGRNLEGGLVPYDLRRSAVRNLVRAGVRESVAMRISGHKTSTTFRRYNITDLADLRDAMTKADDYRERAIESGECAQFAHNPSGTRRCIW